MHPASNDGKWQEATFRIQSDDEAMLWDAYGEFYRHMEATGRPMPPLWRQPNIWGLMLKWLAVDWWAGRRDLDTMTPEVRVSLFVELARRMSPDDLNEAQRRLESDEPA